MKTKTIQGRYALAKIMTDQAEPYAAAQIQRLCDDEAAKGSVIRVMPDVHPGKVGPIGLTMTVGARVLPEVVGIDIGCGVTIAPIGKKTIEFQKLDRIIREGIPAGFAIREKAHRFGAAFPLEELRCFSHIQEDKARRSLGTLGGGNHFIEVGRGGDGTLYAAVHSGSRHLGKEVTEYYLREGQRRLRAAGMDVPYEMTWLEGELLADYLHDQHIVTAFAEESRRAMLDVLDKGMKWKSGAPISCIHNYIDTAGAVPILRKGACAARAGETVFIPIHMQAGILVGQGLGNPDWNESAPHGSGRLMKREDVRARYTVSAYKKEMKGIYSTCIGKDTLDEAPFAYRGEEDIESRIRETVEIQDVLRPVYNFKAGGTA